MYNTNAANLSGIVTIGAKISRASGPTATNDMDEPKIIGGTLVNNQTINRFMFFATAKGDMDVDYFRVYAGEPYDGDI